MQFNDYYEDMDIDDMLGQNTPPILGNSVESLKQGTTTLTAKTPTSDTITTETQTSEQDMYTYEEIILPTTEREQKLYIRQKKTA